MYLTNKDKLMTYLEDLLTPQTLTDELKDSIIENVDYYFDDTEGKTKLFYGEFTFAGYTVRAVAECELILNRILRENYNVCRKTWKEPRTWAEYREYSGVTYNEITVNEVFNFY